MEIKEILKNNKVIYRTYVSLRKKFLPSQDQMMKQISEYYIDRFHKYAGAFSNMEAKDCAYMTWLYHVVEKGLTMPNMRLGFGKDKVLELCTLIDNYESKYGEQGSSFTSAVAVLKEYKRVHDDLNFSLDKEVSDKINQLQMRYPKIKPINQKEVTSDTYFLANELPFEQFSYGRHCVRNFDKNKSINVEDIIQAINLAKNAPSACNRQPTRVHIVTDKNIMMSCLVMQNGSRGFRELADKLLIITGDLSTILGAQEFFDLNTNVGIFIMNLCYALQFKKIGCCILNWYALPKEDIKLRNIINIPKEENVVAFIICGKIPEKFKLAESPRMETERYYTVHN